MSGICRSAQTVKVLIMNTYLKCKLPQNLQKSIKINVVGAQFGAQFVNQYGRCVGLEFTDICKRETTTLLKHSA